MEKENKNKIFIICSIAIILIIVAIVIANKINTNNIVETSNNNTNKEEYTTLLKDVAKIGDYVDYEPIEENFTMSSEETGESDKSFQTSDYKNGWKIIYNDTDNGLQIISSRGITSSFSLSGKFGYNNAVDTLNNFCNHYANNKDFAVSGRCLGSNPKETKDNSTTEEHFSAGAMKLADEYYKTDIEILKQNSSLHSLGENTILASRYKGEQGGLFKYCLRSIDSNGNLKEDSMNLCFTAKTLETEQGVKQFYSMDTNTGYSITGYTRAVITLKQDVKVKGGDGTKDNPYILAK